jgi:hypothetical protein
MKPDNAEALYHKAYSYALQGNVEEDKPTQAEILADIRRDRSFNPASYRLPDSLRLLREDRDR